MFYRVILGESEPQASELTMAQSLCRGWDAGSGWDGGGGWQTEVGGLRLEGWEPKSLHGLGLNVCAATPWPLGA